MGTMWFWFKFRGMKSAFLGGRATLFYMDYSSDAKFALGNIVQLNISNYRNVDISTGEAAWQSVVAAPREVVAALRCRRCRHSHVIRLGRQGMRGKIGRAWDSYQGGWRSPWFSLVAPVLRDQAGFVDHLSCQSCGAQGVPRIRLY